MKFPFLDKKIVHGRSKILLITLDGIGNLTPLSISKLLSQMPLFLYRAVINFVLF